MVDIPDQIRELLSDEEIENIENRNGWALGIVVLSENGDEAERFEGAVIELLNGDGRAGDFGGVNFLAVADGELREAKAYATREAFENSSRDSGWFVEKYTDPEDLGYGQPAP